MNTAQSPEPSYKLMTSCSASIKTLHTYRASKKGREKNEFKIVQHGSIFQLPQSLPGTPTPEYHPRSLQHTHRFCTRDLKLEKSALILALVTPFQLPSGWLQLIKASGSAGCSIIQTLSFKKLKHICFVIQLISESTTYPLKLLRIFSIAQSEIFRECMLSFNSYSLVTKDMAV